ncbi:hypothetical protein [Streptomyces sp. JJ36]|uniref:hypothetical protein n=1 Tax=Streptomyces sp. JJ36 TaxID=2736645 RepID=UPI001F327A9C|nr:hypothetical protein [Streptomyces sp. JJ36]MCF6526330.1 sodium:solute symporter [Streptomyces sp. JJ36]
MLQTWVIVTVSVVYLGVLFAVAFYGDRRADAGRSLINNATIYALSFAVYNTAWSFYGSVGQAATAGVGGFLPIYLGPTVMLALGWLVLRRIIRVSRRHRITSLSDFVSARYGKSALLGGLVTVVAVIGIVPYIALQLKAVSNTFEIIRRYPRITSPSELGHTPLFQDTGLYVALLLAAFTILFGTRHLDATERHEGMVAAIAFESVVKLMAFLAVGIFVTFGVFGGFGDVFAQATDARLTSVFTLEETSYGTWVWLTVLSMLAIVLLPRQWQISVVENVDEKHLKRAMWLFPLYLFANSVFMLPITAGGLLQFGADVDADTYVLAMPMAEGQQALALFVFIGGVSAATGMIIVEAIALSTMVSNSLVMPLLLRGTSRLTRRDDLSGLVLGIRRATIVLILLLGYAYFRFAGEGNRW